MTNVAIQDDLSFDALARAACNLLAEKVGLAWCAAFAPEDGLETCSIFVSASDGFETVPAVDRVAVLEAARDAACDALRQQRTGTGEGFDAVMLRLVGEAEAVVVADADCAIVAQPTASRPLSELRQALAGALPLIAGATTLRAERDAVARENVLLAHIEEFTHTGGWELLVGTDRLVWSREVYAIHGLDPAGGVTLERMLQLYPSPARERLSLEIERAAASGGSFSVTTPICTPTGENRVVRTAGRCVSDERGLRLCGIAQDVTNEIATERRLWWAANHDPVTSLPNRLLFEDRINVAVRRARRENGHFALVLIEIADVARLSETAGYTMPDKHMLEVASRLAAVTRESDTIARISINEFALILADTDGSDTLDSAMSRLKDQFAAVKESEPGSDTIMMSAGIAFYPTHAKGPEELMRAAEIALSQARRKLDSPIVVFDGNMTDDNALRRDTIIARAHESLGRREFVPYYQPQVDMITNAVVGVEALVRWQTPDMTLDAKDFAYALDDHDVGSRVGRAVIDRVIADIADMRQITDAKFRVSINASRTELLRNDFLETFLEKTRAGNLSPEDFIIEITEDVIIGVDDITLHDKLSYLVSSGVQFALDDFGTGYASLIHISSFPVKEIKIDKQFIAGIESDASKRAIVSGILQIAKAMDLTVIAEGVETVAQQDALRQIGCRYAQGYLYSFPVPFAQFAAMLEHADQWTKQA